MSSRELYSIQKILGAFALLFLLLSCGLSDLATKQASAPEITPPPISQAVEIQPTISVDGNSMKISITEQQITQLLQNQLSQQADPLLTNPQVKLDNGVIDITGTLTNGMFSTEIKLGLKVLVDGNGKPGLKVESADLGAIPVPDNLTEMISNMFNIEEILSSQGVDFKIQSIEISGGKMEITRSLN